MICDLCGDLLDRYTSKCMTCYQISDGLDDAARHAGVRIPDVVDWVRRVVKKQISDALEKGEDQV